MCILELAGCRMPDRRTDTFDTLITVCSTRVGGTIAARCYTFVGRWEVLEGESRVPLVAKG